MASNGLYSTSRALQCTCQHAQRVVTRHQSRALSHSTRRRASHDSTGIKSLIDMFTGTTKAQDAPRLPSGPSTSSPSSSTASAYSERPSPPSTFDHHKQAQASASFLGRWIKRKQLARTEADEQAWRRNAEMAKAIERTLRGGARSGPLSGGNTLDIRCTTLDEHGQSLVHACLLCVEDQVRESGKQRKLTVSHTHTKHRRSDDDGQTVQ